MNSRWYVQRTLQAVFTTYLVASLTFVMIRLMPGGPMDYMKAQLLQGTSGAVSQAQMERINAQVSTYVNIQPDQPIWQQYIDYMGSLLQGDFGQSVWFNEGVGQIIANALPWTLFLMSVSLLISFALGIALGAALAYVEGTNWDIGVTTFAMTLNSIPYYIVAILLVYVVGYQLEWFPTSGRLPEDVTPGLSLAFFGGLLYHAALPVFSLVVTGVGGRAMGMRGNSIRVMGEDYVRVAQLRGLNPSWITLSYVARNAILPMYTNLLIAIGFLFGGAVILEQIFSYFGVGYYLIRAISARDYPLMMGCFLVITVAVVIGVYVADLTYGKLDPRIEQGGRSSESY